MQRDGIGSIFFIAELLFQTISCEALIKQCEAFNALFVGLDNVVRLSNFNILTIAARNLNNCEGYLLLQGNVQLRYISVRRQRIKCDLCLVSCRL